jgi:hypothetical protein
VVPASGPGVSVDGGEQGVDFGFGEVVDQGPVDTFRWDRQDRDEGVVVNAEVAIRIEESMTERSYGDLLAAAGVTTVFDEQRHFVEHRPDGSRALFPMQA